MMMMSRVFFLALAIVLTTSGPTFAGKNKTIDALQSAVRQIEKSGIEKSAPLNDAIGAAADLKKNAWKMSRNEVYQTARGLFEVMIDETQDAKFTILIPDWL